MIYTLNNNTAYNYSKFIARPKWIVTIFKKSTIHSQQAILASAVVHYVTAAKSSNSMNYNGSGTRHNVLKHNCVFECKMLLCCTSDLAFFNLRGYFSNVLKAVHLCWIAARNNKRLMFVCSGVTTNQACSEHGLGGTQEAADEAKANMVHNALLKQYVRQTVPAISFYKNQIITVAVSNSDTYGRPVSRNRHQPQTATLLPYMAAAVHKSKISNRNVSSEQKNNKIDQVTKPNHVFALGRPKVSVFHKLVRFLKQTLKKQATVSATSVGPCPNSKRCVTDLANAKQASLTHQTKCSSKTGLRTQIQLGQSNKVKSTCVTTNTDLRRTKRDFSPSPVSPQPERLSCYAAVATQGGQTSAKDCFGVQKIDLASSAILQPNSDKQPEHIKVAHETKINSKLKPHKFEHNLKKIAKLIKLNTLGFHAAARQTAYSVTPSSAFICNTKVAFKNSYNLLNILNEQNGQLLQLRSRPCVSESNYATNSKQHNNPGQNNLRHIQQHNCKTNQQRQNILQRALGMQYVPPVGVATSCTPVVTQEQTYKQRCQFQKLNKLKKLLTFNKKVSPDLSQQAPVSIHASLLLSRNARGKNEKNKNLTKKTYGGLFSIQKQVLQHYKLQLNAPINKTLNNDLLEQQQPIQKQLAQQQSWPKYSSLVRKITCRTLFKTRLSRLCVNKSLIKSKSTTQHYFDTLKNAQTRLRSKTSDVSKQDNKINEKPPACIKTTPILTKQASERFGRNDSFGGAKASEHYGKTYIDTVCITLPRSGQPWIEKQERQQPRKTQRKIERKTDTRLLLLGLGTRAKPRQTAYNVRSYYKSLLHCNAFKHYDTFAKNPWLKQADLIFFFNALHHKGLVNQAKRLQIPTLGIVSGSTTNSLGRPDYKTYCLDDCVHYPIIGNAHSIFFVATLLPILVKVFAKANNPALGTTAS